jgi:multidrug efflux pump subunit AcrA (membrane-fusion protein)
MTPTLFREAARPPGAVDDRLDERVRVVSPRLWLGLLAALLVVAGVLIWSIVTTIPVEVTGQGVIQDPLGLNRVQAPAAGEVTAVLVGSGQRVRAGQVLALVRPGPRRPPVAVRSRSAGIVVAPAVRPGSIVAPGGLVATVEPVSRHLIAFVYVPAQSGQGVRTGQRVLLSPESADADQVGLLEGRVVDISAFPVPPERTILIAGESLGEQLNRKGPLLEVRVQLQRAAGGATGYRWTAGNGPARRLAPGTLAGASIVLGEDRPISRIV